MAASAAAGGNDQQRAPILDGIVEVRAHLMDLSPVASSASEEPRAGSFGRVMYIPPAPWCPRNEAYAPVGREAFVTGSSPTDFPDENHERNWPNRFHVDGLNQTGRRGLGLD